LTSSAPVSLAPVRGVFVEPRGAAARGSDADLDAFLREFRVVTPLDPGDPAIAARRDIVEAWRRDLKQEAPWACKEIGPVVRSLQRAAVAEPVVELRPLLTVKGVRVTCVIRCVRSAAR
jgi:hypothetical protein